MEAEQFGRKLKAIREESGISLEELARETKIRVPNLRRLEAGQFDDLPAEVFVTGFLKAIASFLKCNSTELISDYRSVLRPPVADAGEPEESQEPARPRSAPHSQGVRPVYIAAGAGAVIILFVLALVLQRIHHTGHRIPPRAGNSSTSSASNISNPLAGSQSAAGSRAGAKAPAPAKAALLNSTRPAAPPVETEPKEAVAPKTYGPIPEKTLVIRVVKKCWLELYRTSGTRPLVYHLAQPGEQIAFSGTSFRMTVGDVGAVKIWWKGKPMKLPGGEGSVLKDYTLGGSQTP